MTLELNSRKARLNEQNPVGSCAAGRLDSGAFFPIAARICRKMGGAGRCLVHRACVAQRKDRASPKERFNSASETGQCGTTKKLVPHKLGSYAERERVLEPELCLPQTALLVPRIDLTPCLLKFFAVRPVLLRQDIEVPLEQVDLGHNVPGPVSNVLGGCRRGLVRCPFWCNAVKLRSSGSTLASALSARDCVSRIRARSSFWRSRHLQCGQWSVFEMCVSLAASTAAAAFVDSAGWVSTEGAGERVWVSSTAASVCASQKRPEFSSGRQGTRAVWEVGVAAGRGRTHRCYGRHSVLLRSVGLCHGLECQLA